MVREPVLIGGLNRLVSYTRFHCDYQADSLSVSTSSQGHINFTAIRPRVCRPPSLQAFRASSSSWTSSSTSSSSSFLKSVSELKRPLLVGHLFVLTTLCRVRRRACARHELAALLTRHAGFRLYLLLLLSFARHRCPSSVESGSVLTGFTDAVKSSSRPVSHGGDRPRTSSL